MSLRARILVAVVALAALGLGIAGAATYTALRSFLVERVDEQLSASVDPIIGEIAQGFVTTTPRPARAFVPSGTYAQLRNAGGDVVATYTFSFRGTSYPTPTMPDDLGLPDDSATRRFTVEARGETPAFRVLAVRADNSGTVLAIAAPLDGVQTTLRRLLVIEVVVAACVLLAIGMLGAAVVAAGFRPLRRIEATAAAIAAGDLTQRVEETDPHTEVGRLGLALNQMLEHIEGAFSAKEQALVEKEASEARLRRFVADASHELRTPLTSIRAHAELFRRGAAQRPEDLAIVMRRIEDESARMGGLVEDLLLLTRLDQGRPIDRAPVDLVEIAADSVTDARAVAPDRDIDLEVRAAAAVIGDEARLRQVLANLVQNALVHTPDGTPVRVVVGLDGDTAVLEVSDHGPGLSTEQAARVFERFYRADGSRSRHTGGSGLGLSIVAAIASAHGGSVSVVSSPGTGATFSVRLPVAGPTDPVEVADLASAAAAVDRSDSGASPEEPPMRPPLPPPAQPPIVANPGVPLETAALRQVTGTLQGDLRSRE